MAPSELPENWQDYIADYALGALPSDEMEQVQQWVRDHPMVQAELQAYQEVLALLPYALPQKQPARRVKQHLLLAATGQTAGRSLRSRMTWLGLGLAAALALVLGADNLRLRHLVADRQQLEAELQLVRAERDRLQQRQQNTELVMAALGQPDIAVYTLKGTGPAAQTYGRLMALPDQSEVVFVSHNLPTLSGDRIYRLWAVPDATAEPVFCGQFNNDETGLSHWEVPSNWCTVPPHQLLITIDRITDPPLPTGELVMESQA
jgi:hypothetical protein